MTFEDMGLSPRFQPADQFDLRATLIPLPDVTAELWMGGSHTVVGEPIEAAQLAGCWLVDCAGELPAAIHSAAAAYIPRVFEDIEQTPPQYDRVLQLAGSLADVLRGGAVDLASGDPPRSDDASLLERERPLRIYVLCKQGFNRSALMTGRIMRALGLPGELVVSELRRHRRGALANDAFERLLRE